MKQRRFILSILFLLMLCSCIKNYALNEKDKIKIFYKYDQLIQDLLQDEPRYRVEKGDGFEIFSIDKISKNYQNNAKEYLMFLNGFIKDNIQAYKDLFKIGKGSISPSIYLTKYDSKYKDIYTQYQKIREKYKDILSKYINSMRIIYCYDIAIIDIMAREINPGETTTIRYFTKNVESQPWWSGYYFGLKWGKEAYFKKDDGTIVDRNLRQDYWFYESNLKLCVVHKIKDDKGNYFGELELDFYKLDDFDKVFDEKGNPKN